VEQLAFTFLQTEFPVYNVEHHGITKFSHNFILDILNATQLNWIMLLSNIFQLHRADSYNMTLKVKNA